ncbi:hypothetical protein ACWDSJ_23245 [Nocardia sp. NPDC003482]
MGSTVTVFDLDADLGKLGEFESVWKAQQEKLSWAADTINAAANRVVGGDHWAGGAATRFDGHRRKIVADLDAAAELAGKAATAISSCIHVLRYNQGLLNNEKAKLNGKVTWRETGVGGTVEIGPADAKYTALVKDVVTAYDEIRDRVDKQLKPQADLFTSAVSQLKTWESTWSKRTLRMLNWNIQQGGDGNKVHWPWDKKPDSERQGNQKGDMGDLAQRLIDGKVDVATLQEVFKDGADQLQKELDKRAGPGEKWEVHFGPASDKGEGSHYGLKNEFGNAVVVRTGNGVTTESPTVTELGKGGPGDGETRSTTRVHVNVNR